MIAECCGSTPYYIDNGETIKIICVKCGDNFQCSKKANLLAQDEFFEKWNRTRRNKIEIDCGKIGISDYEKHINSFTR